VSSVREEIEEALQHIHQAVGTEMQALGLRIVGVDAEMPAVGEDSRLASKKVAPRKTPPRKTPPRKTPPRKSPRRMATPKK